MKTLTQYNIQQTLKTIGLSILLFFASAHKVAATFFDGYGHSNYSNSQLPNISVESHASAFGIGGPYYGGPSGNRPGFAPYTPDYIKNIYNGTIPASEPKQDNNADNAQENEKSNEECATVNNNLTGQNVQINLLGGNELDLNKLYEQFTEQANNDSSNTDVHNLSQSALYNGSNGSIATKSDNHKDNQNKPVQLSGLSNNDLDPTLIRVQAHLRSIQEKNNPAPNNQANDSDQFNGNGDEYNNNPQNIMDALKGSGNEDGSGGLVMLDKEKQKDNSVINDQQLQAQLDGIKLDANENKLNEINQKIDNISSEQEAKEKVDESDKQVQDAKYKLDLVEHKFALNEKNEEEIEKLQDIAKKEEHNVNKQKLTVEQQKERIALLNQIKNYRKRKEELEKEEKANKKTIEEINQELNIEGNQAMSQASKTNVFFQINPEIVFLYLLCAYFIRYIYVNFPKFNVPMLIRV